MKLSEMCDAIAESWNRLAPIHGKPYDGRKVFDELTGRGQDFSGIGEAYEVAMNGGAIWPKRLRDTSQEMAEGQEYIDLSPARSA